MEDKKTELTQQDSDPPLGTDLSSIEVVLETDSAEHQLFRSTEIPNSDFNKSALLGPTPFKYEMEVFKLYIAI